MTDVAHTAEKAGIALEALQLTNDNMLVHPLAVPEKMGQFFIPETAGSRERPQRGVVVCIGPGAWNEAGTARRPTSIPVGALVFFGKYAGQDESVAGVPLLLMAEDEAMMFVGREDFTVTVHEDRKFDHLAGDSCPICDQPAEDEAAAALALERERLRADEDAAAKCKHSWVRDGANPDAPGFCTLCGVSELDEAKIAELRKSVE